MKFVCPLAALVLVSLLVPAPVLASCPSNPASVVCTGGPVALTDDGYDGTLGSMACLTCTYVIDPACPDELKGPPSFEIAVTHTWVGDLAIKIVNPPAGGSIEKRVMSRPGFGEGADDGTGCCGDSDDWLGDTLTFEPEGTGNTPAEDMGAAGGVVCSGDGICLYDAHQGVGFPGTDDDLTDFVGIPAAGDWLVCVGDSAAGDVGTLDSATITFTQLPVELQSFSIE